MGIFIVKLCQHQSSVLRENNKKIKQEKLGINIRTKMFSGNIRFIIITCNKWSKCHITYRYVNLLQLRNMPEVITKLIIITIYFNYYFEHLGY